MIADHPGDSRIAPSTCNSRSVYFPAWPIRARHAHVQEDQVNLETEAVVQFQGLLLVIHDQNARHLAERSIGPLASAAGLAKVINMLWFLLI